MWPVTNLIPLIGWNYSIQTGENILTNESTQIYKMSHGSSEPGLWLNLTEERDLHKLRKYVLNAISQNILT